MESERRPGGTTSETLAAAAAADQMLTYTVNGTIISATSASVGNLTVQIVDKNAGPDVPLAQTTSDDNGRYTVSFQVSLASLRARNKTRADLQARVWLGHTFLAASDVAYGAPASVTLSVTIPASVTALPSEHETLTRMLGAVYSGRLGDLQENGDRTDITYLANKTGWDARAVALAALADQFSQRRATTPAASASTAPANTPAGTDDTALPAAFYYALFRAGLPANAETLYRANLKTVGSVWTQATQQGVIPRALAPYIPRALAAFQQHKAANLLDVPPRPNASTVRTLLQLTFGNDQTRQQQFAMLQTQHEGDLPGFWAAIQQTFGAATAARLQLDGQLALLTLNNAPLMAKLYAEARGAAPPPPSAAAPAPAPAPAPQAPQPGMLGRWLPGRPNGGPPNAAPAQPAQPAPSALASLLDLVRRGYYDSAPWLKLLNDVPIPAAPGKTPDEQRASYAALMAAQLRLSYPTAALAEMVNAGAVPLTNDTALRGAVYQFLVQNQGKYELGVEPLDEYLAANGLTGKVHPAVVAQIKRLQRVYQITPGDAAMNALLAKNVDSAYKIVHYGQAAFVRAFQDGMGGAQVAEQTFAKAQSVYHAVLNVTVDYLSRAVAPSLGGGTAPLIEPMPAKANGHNGHAQTNAASQMVVDRLNNPQPPASSGAGAGAAATLEQLFGSMDYCACDECRSILGPAAYLVDLLNFTDCQAPPSGTANPQTVLNARRPDLQQLPLTCENTNTALPYIDLVNETLEYYAAHGSLAGFAGFSNDGSVTSAELIASPQNVNDAAYNTLKTTYFPPPLPFDRSLEYMRRLFQKFDIALADAMAALRANDAVERPSATAYAWRDILMERLGLSREEYQVLTDSTLTLQQLYGPTLGASIGSLSAVQDYARGLGISFDDLLAIVKTRFINPNANLIPLLEALDVPFTTLAALKNGTLPGGAPAFLALLPTGAAAPNPANYGGDIVAWVTDTTRYAQIMGLIILTNPTDPADLCSIDGLQFRYSNPDNTANQLQPIDFVRLLRFIRLWRKLGLSIQQTDDLIAALAPAIGSATTLAALDTAFLALLPRIGFAYQVMAALNLSPAADLAGLLACWGPIGATGAGSLYASMFLNPAVLRQDPAFAPDANGNVLQDATQKLLDHAPALRAAFNLTANELTLITQALGFDATTPLTLTNISRIYGRGWLARELGISVAELLLLTRFTGLDPFAAPDPSSTPPAEPPVVRFIRLAQAMSAASLQPVQALYLLWNQDISGTSAPTTADVTALALTLRSDFAAASAQFAIADDPTGAIAKSLMTLVYGTAATNFFFGLLDNTFTTSVAYGGGVPQSVLDATKIGSTDPLSYDDFAKQLTYAGVLDTPTFNAINTAITLSGGNAALTAAVDQLHTQNQAAVNAFFAQYPGLQAPYTAYATSSDPLQKRRTTLLNSLLPLIEPLRKQEQALADVTAAAGIDASFANALLTDPNALVAVGNTSVPPPPPAPPAAGVADLTAIEAPGLAAQFYLTNNTALPADQAVDNVPALAYAAGTATTLPPGSGGSKIAGIWSGFITCPQDGDYDLSITTDAGAVVTLSIGGTTIAGIQSGTVWTNTDAIALTAGKLTPIVLTVTGLTSTLALSWRSAVLGLQLVPGQYLYSQRLVDHLAMTYTRFLKATSLATALALDAKELAFLATDAELKVQSSNWVNALTVTGDPTTGAALGFAAVLDGLLAYARLKHALAPKDDRLLAVVENPDATLPNGQSALLTLTGWDQATRDALLQQFFGSTATAPLTSVGAFARVYDAALVIKRCGIGAAALLAAATNVPTAQTVIDFEAAVRARYAAADWLTAIKPINDTMRLLQRDALVPYVLQLTANAGAVVDVNTKVDTPDTLFEYLLMDVQMDCCMLTSRIRLALSSVQLFVERCIRSLEVNHSDATKNVDPSDFPADHWVWMKRYRVWEANREVFLWPENWLYPELRDDQSPFFKSIMSKLLQSDISDDAAAYAYLEYLADLEDVAKLEPCALCYVPASAQKPLATAHVVSRTSGAKRKYHYRFFDGANWGPWEQIPLTIEDNPLALALWNNRLLLFWLQVVQTPGTPNTPGSGNSDAGTQVTSATVAQLASGLASAMGPSAPAQVNIQVNLFWSEYYNGKWHPAKSSDTNNPATLGTWYASGADTFDRGWISLYAYPDADPSQKRLWLLASGLGQQASFCFYNTHSPPVTNPWNSPTETANPYDRLVYPPSEDDPGTLEAWYTYSGFDAFNFGNDLIAPTNPTLLDHVVAPVHPLQPDPGAQDWTTPFFYGDTLNEFYVRTVQDKVTVTWQRNYGIVGNIPFAASQLAGLVLKNVVLAGQPGPRPNPIDPIETLANVNPAAITRYVTEDAYISRGLSSIGAVKYGAATIGVSGALGASAGAGAGATVAAGAAARGGAGQ